MSGEQILVWMVIGRIAAEIINALIGAALLLLILRGTRRL